MSAFREIKPNEILSNPFDLIGRDWALVGAENGGGCNAMTASWGGVGIMWNKPVAFTFIRPQRYTFELIEKEACYTLSFFEEKYRDALRLCGTKSGRDCDKVREAGLTPRYDCCAPYFEEAKLVLVCKKLYGQLLNEESIIEQAAVAASYTAGDFHKMYIGEIVKVLVKSGL